MAIHFRDRQTAGKLLAIALEHYVDNPDVVIYALPRGGVVIGVEIARVLRAKLDLVIARKIGHQEQEEFAIGAVTEKGVAIFDSRALLSIDPRWLESAVVREQGEAARRREVYLKGHARTSARGKIAIIVDDGVATGLTVRAAIRALRAERPSKIVVAVPVAPPDVARVLEDEADELVVLDAGAGYLGSVGAYYDVFPQVTDEEVVHALRVG